MRSEARDVVRLSIGAILYELPAKGNVGEDGAGALGGYEKGVIDTPREMGY